MGSESGPAGPRRFSGIEVAGLLAAWFWLMLLPSRLPTPTLEPSWQTVLNFAAAHHLQHGVDIMFTYGPLGYLMQSCFYPGTWLSVLVFQVLSRGFYVVMVVQLAQRSATIGQTNRWALIAFVVAALWLPALDGDSFYLMFIVFVGACACGDRAAKPTKTTTAVEWTGIFALGLLALIKTTFLMFSITTLLLVLVSAVYRGRRALAVGALPVFAGTLIFGWAVLGHQHLENVAAWMRGSSELTRTYQLTMGLWPDPNQLVSGLLAFLLVLGGLVAAVGRSRRNLPLVLIVFAGIVLAWKQSFTRGDEYHTRTFFVFILAAGAMLPALFQVALNRAVAVLLAGVCLGSSLLVRLPIPVYRGFENLRFLARLPQRHHLWVAQARRYDLPEFRRIIGDATVDVAGAEQAIAVLNSFNYDPAPVFQPYAAGTPYLANLNAAFYRSERAPEFVITHGYTIDNRLPNLDDAVAGLIISQRYNLVATENGFRLLRRSGAAEGTLVPASSGEVSTGQPIQLTGRWCEVIMNESVLGRVIRLVWMSPPVFAELRYADGRVDSCRFLPSMARSGFLAPDGATTLTITPSPVQRLCFRPRITYRLARIASAPP